MLDLHERRVFNGSESSRSKESYMRGLTDDFRGAFRSLTGASRFAVRTAGTIALSLGPMTAVVKAVLLQSAPLRRA